MGLLNQVSPLFSFFYPNFIKHTPHTRDIYAHIQVYIYYIYLHMHIHVICNTYPRQVWYHVYIPYLIYGVVLYKVHGYSGELHYLSVYTHIHYELDLPPLWHLQCVHFLYQSLFWLNRTKRDLERSGVDFSLWFQRDKGHHGQEAGQQEQGDD